MATASPLSSPRLPSPPPIAEDQLGPKSPAPTSGEQQKLFSSIDHGASRRIRPGTKAADMAEGPPLVELKEIDSAFQLTEHLKALHHHLTHPDGNDSTIAVDKEMAYKLAQPPENVDRALWLYELCRFLTQKANSMIIALFSDDPPCSANTCPEMRASEWQYLCAVHEPPKACCAIDYCCHTLDWAANTLTSTKHFPSRLEMGTDSGIHNQQMRQLTNIYRRVYRIFAHAWFQHRDVFWKVEGRTGLYILFKTVCDVYGLIPEDNYTIPSEAEGLDAAPQPAPPMILRREPSGPGSQESGAPSMMEGMVDHTTLSTAGTTKRHRHSPSVGAMSVSTVVEEAEEEAEEPTEKRPTTAELAPAPADQGEETSKEDPTTAQEPSTAEKSDAPAAEAAEEVGPAEKQKQDEDKPEEAPSDDKPEAEGAAEQSDAGESKEAGGDQPTEAQSSDDTKDSPKDEQSGDKEREEGSEEKAGKEA